MKTLTTVLLIIFAALLCTAAASAADLSYSPPSGTFVTISGSSGNAAVIAYPPVNDHINTMTLAVNPPSGCSVTIQPDLNSGFPGQFYGVATLSCTSASPGYYTMTIHAWTSGGAGPSNTSSINVTIQ